MRFNWQAVKVSVVALAAVLGLAACQTPAPADADFSRLERARSS